MKFRRFRLSKPDVGQYSDAHEWVVTGRKVEQDILLVQCRLSGAQAFVACPTRAEWNKAEHADKKPFRLTNGVNRVRFN